MTTDIKHLHYFMEVAIHKSFTKAARKLFVTQPTISKMVRDVEGELGLKLLDRSGKQIELTDAGKIVFEQSLEIVHSFDHLSDELSELTKMKKGKLTIGLPPMIGVYFFPIILGQFRAKYPGIDLHIVEYGAKKVAECVADGSLDVGVTVGPFNQNTCESFYFYDDPIQIVVNSANSLANQSNLSIEDLKNESFILFPEEFSLHGMILKSCEKAGYQPHIVLQSSQWEFMIELVAQGLGIAMLPQSVLKKTKNNKVKQLPLREKDLTWHLSMIWKKNHYLSFATRTWIRETKKILLGC